eukprot:TRINITY_DN1397_c0_g1_i2.p1 TRINITY_DN1397_c0_g1~~TRINITY_DN1397_c0_g1_i2.p1  ORF type:complete len:179 (+),score=28.43 TRINITY_DN1397_c0_g1_i2:68-604(+)
MFGSSLTRQIFEESSYTDCTFLFEGEEPLHAHLCFIKTNKLLFAKCEPFITDDQRCVVEMDCSRSAFKSVLCSIYGFYNPMNVPEVILLAEEYGLTKLKLLSEDNLIVNESNYINIIENMIFKVSSTVLDKLVVFIIVNESTVDLSKIPNEIFIDFIGRKKNMSFAIQEEEVYNVDGS